MEAVLTRILPLAALTVLAARPTLTSGPTPVQKPFNLRKISYNLNTTLSWDYDTTSVAPYFQVEYRNNGWTIVETCVNISRNYCDLSEKIVDPYGNYYVRVKAFVGSEESDYAKTGLNLIEDGIIGPPALSASSNGKFIYIDLSYPHVPHVNGKMNVGDYVEDLTYDVYYGDNMEETKECDRFGCSVRIMIQNQTRYCFSALGKSNLFPMTMEKSEEICISTAVTNVQKPFNLKKKSYNFNTTLSWDYDTSSVAPYFQVEYRNSEWTIVETCVNISRKYCDLSEKIVDPYIHYYVRIKAFVGSEESEYAKMEVYLIEDGIIGPPALNASHDEKFIYIDSWYPDAPRVNGKMNVGDYVEDLTYDVYYEDDIEETNECDRFGCSVRILIQNQTRYCFSALGKSNLFPMTMEKSEEICISTAVTNGTSKELCALIVSISVVAIGSLVLSFYIIKKQIAPRSVIPASLNSIAKVIRTQVYLPSDQITRYDQVSVSPVDSPEEKMTPQEVDKDLNVSDHSDIRESIDHGYQSSLGSSETQQVADEDQNGKEESNSNYYHTENSDSTIVCVKEDDVTEQEPLRDIKPVTNSYGYDKPHCPL